MSAVLEETGAAGKVSPDLEAFAREIAAPAEQAPAASSPPGATGTTAAPGAIDYRQEARDLWRVIAMLKLRWPSVSNVLHDRAVEQLGEVWGPILERHKIDMGHLTIYFTAAIATAPVAGDLWIAIRADSKARKEGAPLPVPPGGSENFTSKAASSSPASPIPTPPSSPAPAAPPRDHEPSAPPDTSMLHLRA